MLIPEDILELAKTDPLEAAVNACQYCIGQIDMAESNAQWSVVEHDLLLETFAFISALIEADVLDAKYQHPTISGDLVSDSNSLLSVVRTFESQLSGQASLNKITALKRQFSSSIASRFVYTFTDGDLARIQTLLNELRSLVAGADDIHAEHKQRILKRLERLQSELHKTTSDLSRFYSLFGEAGVAAGKFGEDAKPIVDRVREILQITWRTQAAAEELPSGTTPPLLEKGSD